MKIEKTSPGKYRVQYVAPNGNRVRRTVTASCEAEAVAKAYKQGDHERPVQRRTGRSKGTVSEMVTLAMRERWAGTKNEREQARLCEALVARLGADTPVESLTSEKVAELVAEWRAAGNSAATINRKLCNISGALSVVSERWSIDALPRIPRLAEESGRTRVLSGDEEEALFEALSGSPLAPFFSFLLDTGCRVGEAMKLSGRDIDTAQGLVTFEKTKNGQTRVVPYGTFRPDVPDMLKERRLRERVFLQVNHDKIRRVWSRARKQMGLSHDREFTPHCLRHTCGTRLWVRTNDIYMVKKWLGHSDLKTTERYTHVTPTDLLRVRDADRFRHALRQLNPSADTTP